MSHGVEQELNKLFGRGCEDLTKGHAVLQTKESLSGCADRFIKLAKRFYDIYKLFEEEFGGSLDVIAAKAMLHFTRGCFIVTHVLINTDWLNLRELPTVRRQIVTLPKRAMHKVWKKTFKKKEYNFVHTEEQYRQSGLSKVLHEQDQKKRNYTDELYNLAISLKDMGLKLILVAKACGLIDESIKLSNINKQTPSVGDMDLRFAKQDLGLSHQILNDYYVTVIEQLQKEEQLVQEGKVKEGEIDSDECLPPLLEKFEMNAREVLRGEVDDSRQQTKFLDVRDSVGDLKEVSKLIVLLDHGPEM